MRDWLDAAYGAKRIFRGQWSAFEREEKIKFWAELDRNNSRPGAYEVGVEHGIVSQLANASGHGRDFDEHRLNFMLSVIKGIEARDQLEAMLAAQMAAVHMASMTFSGRRMHGGALGSGAPRGNKNALKHGRFTREAIAERGHIRELVRQARKLLLQIE
jgi:hypothetical protein